MPSMTKPLYAVIGNPISHSKSPQIHALFAKQTQQALEYTAVEGNIDAFNASVTEFRRHGGLGLNVTVPFKEEAYAFADVISPRAQRAGAVNTLTLLPDNSTHGDTTDGEGLLRDLTVNHKASLKNKTILILGAGGAVKGILEPLLDEQPAHITIANRTAEKAVLLAEAFLDKGSVTGCGFQDIKPESYDWVINGTSASLHGELPPIPKDVIGINTHCYDMMYQKDLTPFLAWAKSLGAKSTIDGLGMLVEQAAVSFEIWRGVKPDTQPVITMIRNSLK